MKNKKYELVPVENWQELGLLPYTIRALREIRDPKTFRVVIFKGELGGYVEHADNLSQKGTCWIADQAKVAGGAIISGHATIKDRAVVCGNARVTDYALVAQDGFVAGSAILEDNARVLGCASVYGSATMAENSVISEEAEIAGGAVLYSDVEVGGSVFIAGDVVIVEQGVVLQDAHFIIDRSSKNKALGIAEAVDEVLDVQATLPELSTRSRMCGAKTSSNLLCKHRVKFNTTQCRAGHQVME